MAALPVQKRSDSLHSAAIFLYSYSPSPAQAKATVAGPQRGILVDVLTADDKVIGSQRSDGKILELPVASFAKGLMLVLVKNKSGVMLSSTKLMKN